MTTWGIIELELLKCLSLKIQEATSKSAAITENLVTLRTSNKKHDWTPVKYVNILHLNRTQKQLRHFLLDKLPKYYQLPLNTLDMSGHFHKNHNINLYKFWCLSAGKKSACDSTPNFFFCDIKMIMQPFYFE